MGLDNFVADGIVCLPSAVGEVGGVVATVGGDFVAGGILGNIDTNTGGWERNANTNTKTAVAETISGTTAFANQKTITAPDTKRIADQPTKHCFIFCSQTSQFRLTCFISAVRKKQRSAGVCGIWDRLVGNFNARDFREFVIKNKRSSSSPVRNMLKRLSDFMWFGYERISIIAAVISVAP